MEENDLLWAVVLFLDDNSIATIPNSWLQKKGVMKYEEYDVAYWPPRTKNATSIVKRREEPCSSWMQFKVKILGIYDNYDTAVKKSVTAEETSDLSSANEGARKRIRNKKYRTISTSSESDETDCEKYDRRMPRFPSPLKKNEIDSTKLPYSSQQQARKSLSLQKCQPQGSPSSQCSLVSAISSQEFYVQNNSELQTDNTHQLQSINSKTVSSPGTPRQGIKKYTNNDPRKDNDLRNVLCNTQPNSPASCSTTSDTDFQKQVLRKLNVINAKLSRQEEQLEVMQGLLDRKMFVDEVTADDVITTADYFPLRNDQDLENLETFLQDKSNFHLLVSELSRIGGTTAAEITKKIMYRIMSNELGQLYSWEGGRGKRKFVNLPIKKVIFDAVRRNKRTENACDDEMAGVIKKWLVKAKERSQYKLKKNKENAPEEK